MLIPVAVTSSAAWMIIHFVVNKFQGLPNFLGLSKQEKYHCGSRTISFLHAIWCFIGLLKLLTASSHSIPPTFFLLGSIGYFLCTLIVKPVHDTIIRHILYGCLYSLGLTIGYGTWWIGMMLMFEIPTPFLHFAWIGLKTRNWTMFSKSSIFVIFLSFLIRIVGSSILILNYFRNITHLRSNFDGSPHILTVFNLLFSGCIILNYSSFFFLVKSVLKKSYAWTYTTPLYNSCIYDGKVMHRRYKANDTNSKVNHDFAYRVFYMLIDLDEVGNREISPFRSNWCWSVGRLNMACLLRRDHLRESTFAPKIKKSFGNDALHLAESVRQFVEKETGVRPDGSVKLLTHLRYFGVSFNPISLFYCYDKKDNIQTIVLEVHNTPWNEQHCYVLPVKCKGNGQFSIGPIAFDKKFHVSPFMPMMEKYEWNFNEPGQSLHARTDLYEKGIKVFDASVSLDRKEITGLSLAYCLIRFPCITFMTQCYIHYQAYKLWKKGATFFPHPKGAQTRMSRLIAWIVDWFVIPLQKFFTKGEDVSPSQSSPICAQTEMDVSPSDPSTPYSQKEMPTLETIPMKVAVVGSGISGLSTAWLLRKKHEVHLFEKQERLGGHSYTLDIEKNVSVDLGFQVFNQTAYPHLTAMFNMLGIETQESDMSLAISLEQLGQKNLEWSSVSPCSLLNFRLWRILWDMIWFNRDAANILKLPANHPNCQMTVGEHLQKNGYSSKFREMYVIPMIAAIWSVPSDDALNFPFRSFASFCRNHRLLQIFRRPQWRTLTSRSKSYVERLASDLSNVHLGEEIKSIRILGPNEVEVECTSGKCSIFNAVIFACHGDQTMKILSASNDFPERKQLLDVLDGVKYFSNDVYVHTDETLMPSKRNLWSAWNVMQKQGENKKPVLVTYWSNILQKLPTNKNIFVTLNPPTGKPSKESIIHQVRMAHPAFNSKTLSSQNRLPGIQGLASLYFCGAWCGYGFHEDGLQSAVDVTCRLGVSPPWQVRKHVSGLSWWVYPLLPVINSLLSRAKIGRLRFILPNGQELSNTTKRCPGKEVVIKVHDERAIWRIFWDLAMGLAEGYMNGEWTSEPDLQSVFTFYIENVASYKFSYLTYFPQTFGNMFNFVKHIYKSNTRDQAKENIAAHYDLSNDMFATFLDKSMTYSCAIFNTPSDTLYMAQINKLDAIIDTASITSQDNVMEIGCGWGSCAIRAVQRTGCRWTGISLSQEQLDFANERVREAGLSDKISLKYYDYRDAATLGEFDKVISIEMIEAVGHQFLPVYFKSIDQCLRPGGKAVLQAIIVPDERYDSYRKTSDFIRKHIFPGGHLVSCAEIKRVLPPGMTWVKSKSIGLDYARTLHIWQKIFQSRKLEVLKLGFPKKFYRMFDYYFAYCEAAFEKQYIDTVQVLINKA